MLYKIILCAPTILCLFHCCEFMSTRKRRVVDFSFECQFQSIHVEINLSWINEWRNFPKHLLYEFLVLPFKKLNFFIFFTRSDARCYEEYLSFISIWNQKFARKLSNLTSKELVLGLFTKIRVLFSSLHNVFNSILLKTTINASEDSTYSLATTTKIAKQCQLEVMKWTNTLKTQFHSNPRLLKR